MRPARSMSARIAAAVLLGALVPLALLGGVVYAQQSEEVRADALDTVQVVADVQAARVEAFESASITSARLVANGSQLARDIASGDPPRPEALARITTALADARAASPAVLAVSVTDLHGMTIASTLPGAVGTTAPGFGGLDVERPDATALLVLPPRRNGPGPGDAERPVGPARPPRLVALVPTHLDGGPVGAVVVEFDLQPLIEVARDVEGLGATGETLVGVATPDGNAVFVTPLRLDPEAQFSREVARESGAAIIRALDGEQLLLDDVTDYRGEAVLAATRFQPRSGIGLVVKVDRAEAFAPVRGLVRLLLLGLALAALTAALTAWALGRYLARPVRELQGVARRIGDGDLDARADPDAPGELGELAAVVNRMAMDVTETRQGLETEVAARTAELEDNLLALEARNDELDAFASAVAHDLKSPLTVIQVALETISLGRATPEQFEPLLEAAANSTRGMRELIDDLLLLARATAGELAITEVPLADLVAELSDQLDLHATVDVTAMPTVHADRRLLKQALQNLLDNAARYGGGAISVVGLVGEDGSSVVAVDDDGPGIPEDERASVFEPFQRGTTSSGTSGSGVGLAIVARVAERHGGSVEVLTAPDGGARMLLRLPRPTSNGRRTEG